MCVGAVATGVMTIRRSTSGTASRRRRTPPEVGEKVVVAVAADNGRVEEAASNNNNSSRGGTSRAGADRADRRAAPGKEDGLGKAASGSSAPGSVGREAPGLGR